MGLYKPPPILIAENDELLINTTKTASSRTLPDVANPLTQGILTGLSRGVGMGVIVRNPPIESNSVAGITLISLSNTCELRYDRKLNFLYSYI